MKHWVLSIVAVASLVPAVARADARTHAFVHLAGADTATLERRSPRGGWETVCYTPCNQELPLGVEYRIAGDGLRTSSPFFLDRDKPRIELDAGAATTRGHHAGIALVAVGGGAAAVGLALISAAFYAQWENDQIFGAFGRDAPLDMGYVLAGIVTAAFGTALAVSGIVMAAAHGKSSVEQVAYEPAVAPRSPTWREAASGPTITVRPTTFSLFSGRF